jgi:thioester reductase-like protein
MAEGRVLITGADGYIGSRLARKYRASTDLPLLLWIRARDVSEFECKKAVLQDQFPEAGKRILYACGDLGQPEPFAIIDPGSVGSIIHAAAVTRFNVDATTARQVNIEGTIKLLNFAETCKGLERFALISTIYSSGLKDGLIAEQQCDGSAGFANHYERSKWEAEAAVIQRQDRLPWKIFRVATIIADDDAGRVVQYNAFHNTLKLFYYGLLSVIPGDPNTPLYFVTGDFVTEAIYHSMDDTQERSIYHVTHRRAESPTLAGLIDTAFETFQSDDGFRKRRVLRPLYSDLESFNLLADGLTAFGQGVMGQAVSSVSPFAPQLFVNKDVDNHNLRAAVGSYSPPVALDFLNRTCAHLVATRWGRGF